MSGLNGRITPMLQDLEALVRCESPSEDIDACRKVISLANEIALKQLGSAADIREVNGRPVFWWGDKNPKVVLLCHLDTVWPIGSFNPIWNIEGDVLRGPGTFDMKVGFVQALHALKGIKGSVALIATTDEEIGSHASRDLIKEVSKNASAVLVLEASLDGKVKTGRKGTAMYVVKAIGLASHAGLEPENGINATVEISKLINQIIQLADSKSGTTVVPTVLQSGTTTNTVPEVATLDIDCRSFEMKQLQRIDSEIRKLQSSSAKVEVSGAINRPPLEEQNSKQLFQILNNKLKSVGKSEVLSAAVGGASDGNLAAAAGAQVLDGLGAVGHGAHAKTEHILKSKIESQIEMAKLLIQELCK